MKVAGARQGSSQTTIAQRTPRTRLSIAMLRRVIDALLASPRALAGLAGLGALVLYIRTAAPTVATLFDDSLEFQVVLPTLGIAHPSGYPLYTLLGKLASLLLPLRDPAGRINLLSAGAAGLAIGFYFLVAHRLAGRRLVAGAVTLAFAISPAWWSQATIAEVYTLHGLLVALFLYLLLRWEQAALAQQPAADGWLRAAALAAGLGMAHHRMIALFLPAALVFIAWTDPRILRQPRRWLAPILLGLSPLLLYLYLPLRGRVVTSLDGTFQATAAGTLDWIMARAYNVFLTGNPFNVQRDAAFFLRLFLDQWGAIFLLLAVLALAVAWRQGWRRYAFLVLATIPHVAFGVLYKTEDVAVFFIPAFMLVGWWVAAGLTKDERRRTALRQGAERKSDPATGFGRGRSAKREGAIVLLLLLALASPVAGAVRAFPQLDRSQAWGVYDYGDDMLQNAEQGGQVIGLLGETSLLRYFRDVLGRRPDLGVVPADSEDARHAALAQALGGITAAEGSDRSVESVEGSAYLTRDLPGAAGRYSLDASGPLIRVSPKASPTALNGGQPVGAGIRLLAAQPDLRQTHAGPVVRLTLTWAAETPIGEPLKVSARLIGPAGETIVQDDRVPVHFAYPTTAWVPGEPVEDVYDLPMPPEADIHSHSILLILYREANGEEVGRTEIALNAIP